MDNVECHHARCFNPVYAKGVCRKHYDRERRESAAPRLIERCGVEGCGLQSAAQGLCNTHYHRMRLHGTTDSTRPADWGAKEAHPLYGRWTSARRKPHRGQRAMVDEWHDDFWAFVSAVGDPPDGSWLQRIRRDDPLGPGNFVWKECMPSSDRAAYMREWAKRNQSKVLNSDLKKKYGITLDQYEALSAAQGGVCAICGGQNKTRNSHGSVDRLVVDHCHSSQKIRGLLCHPCNRAIGLLREDVETLHKAITYLSQE